MFVTNFYVNFKKTVFFLIFFSEIFDIIWPRLTLNAPLWFDIEVFSGQDQIFLKVFNPQNLFNPQKIFWPSKLFFTLKNLKPQKLKKKIQNFFAFIARCQKNLEFAPVRVKVKFRLWVKNFWELTFFRGWKTLLLIIWWSYAIKPGMKDIKGVN